MTRNKDFIYISNEHYLQEMGYDSIEEWASDSDYFYDFDMDVWRDEEGEIVSLNDELSHALEDMTWGWDIHTHALDQEYKMNIDGDYWVDRKGRYQVYPEAELIEQFFDDQKAIRNEKRKRKELENG